MAKLDNLLVMGLARRRAEQMDEDAKLEEEC